MYNFKLCEGSLQALPRNYDMMITLMSARVPSTIGPQYFDIMEKQLGKAGLRRFY